MNLDTVAELLTLEFQSMYRAWGKEQPLRTTLHASAVLVAEADWCVRQHTLMALYPDATQRPDIAMWEWKKMANFKDGWARHEKWQKLFKQFANVIYFCGDAELDLTHYDDTRQLHFSPDALIEFGGTTYVVEIKGLDTRKYQELTDDLDTACSVSDVVAKARVQGNLYAHLLNLSRAILLIEDKNTQEFKCWVIETDSTLARTYTNRMYAVKGATALARVDPSKVPSRICQSRDDSRARKCPLRELCFNETWEER